MTRKVQRVRYHLDARGIRSLLEADIRAILRGADDLIMRGGRSLLVKILKGSRSQDVLSQSLELSPVYGRFRHLAAAQVLARVDWVILNGYLTLEYDHRLPLLIYTPRGWAIEREIYADELLQNLNHMLIAGQDAADLSYLKDKNREVIWLLLDKVEATGDTRYIPLLSAWEQIDYKKVRQRIRQVIERLNKSDSEPTAAADQPCD